MKIVIISTYPPRGEKHSATGGVASYTKNLATNIPLRAGDELQVLCNKLNGADNYVEGNIHVWRCFDKRPRYVIQLLRQIQQIRPDVVHIQQELALFGGLFTAYLLQWLLLSLMLLGYKTVITLHGVVDLGKVDAEFVARNNSKLPPALVKLALYLIYKPLTMWSDVVIVHEELFRCSLASSYGVPLRKVTVIPHGVEDLQPIPKNTARKALGLSVDLHVVLFMGYLTGYKGIDILIDGFAKYAKLDPKAYIIIGAGKHPKLVNNPDYIAKVYEPLAAKARELVSADRYRWPGFIEENDMAAYFSAADVSVYPYTIAMSSSGPMSISIGYGLPFLASAAFRGVFDDTMIFATSASALSEKLHWFFDSPSQWPVVAGLRRQRRWVEVAKRHREVYE